MDSMTHQSESTNQRDSLALEKDKERDLEKEYCPITEIPLEKARWNSILQKYSLATWKLPFLLAIIAGSIITLLGVYFIIVKGKDWIYNCLWLLVFWMWLGVAIAQLS